jgi:hypothetical protein
MVYELNTRGPHYGLYGHTDHCCSRDSSSTSPHNSFSGCRSSKPKLGATVTLLLHKTFPTSAAPSNYGCRCLDGLGDTIGGSLTSKRRLELVVTTKSCPRRTPPLALILKNDLVPTTSHRATTTTIGLGALDLGL